MHNEINNIDDLFDDNIGESLCELGFIFPRTATHFLQIESQIEGNQAPKLNHLKDPLLFLGKRSFKRKASNDEFSETGYNQNLAQAAREGDSHISEEIKRKMAEDKAKANQKKPDN